MKRILLSILLVCAFLFVNAQTYTTIANGNWSSPSTWAGGIVPPTTINPSMTVNINHNVIYNQGNDLTINGGQLNITDTLRFPNNGSTGTGRSIFVNNNGLLSVVTGALIMPALLTSGSNNSGNIIANNGRIEFINSYTEIAQNWEATNNSRRKFINSCLRLGENYKNTNSTDTLQGVCIEMGLHGSGDFMNDGGTIRFNSTAILLRGTSGNFTNSSSPSSQILTYGNPSAAIVALDVPGNLENSGTWVASIANHCVSGNVSGSQAGAIDFTNPENCTLVNSGGC